FSSLHRAARAWESTSSIPAQATPGITREGTQVGSPAAIQQLRSRGNRRSEWRDNPQVRYPQRVKRAIFYGCLVPLVALLTFGIPMGPDVSGCAAIFSGRVFSTEKVEAVTDTFKTLTLPRESGFTNNKTTPMTRRATLWSARHVPLSQLDRRIG